MPAIELSVSLPPPVDEGQQELQPRGADELGLRMTPHHMADLMRQYACDLLGPLGPADQLGRDHDAFAGMAKAFITGTS